MDTYLQVQGINEAIRSLNKIEPGLRKQFASEVREIAQPAISEARRRYGFRGLPLSGMQYNWQYKKRKVFPYSVTKAESGVNVQLDAGRRSTATILIIQRNAGASIFEAAGRATRNNLGRQLGPLAPGKTRILGPAVYAKRRQIQEQIYLASLRVVRRVERELA